MGALAVLRWKAARADRAAAASSPKPSARALPRRSASSPSAAAHPAAHHSRLEEAIEEAEAIEGACAAYLRHLSATLAAGAALPVALAWKIALDQARARARARFVARLSSRNVPRFPVSDDDANVRALSNQFVFAAHATIMPRGHDMSRSAKIANMCVSSTLLAFGVALVDARATSAKARADAADKAIASDGATSAATAADAERRAGARARIHDIRTRALSFMMAWALLDPVHTALDVRRRARAEVERDERRKPTRPPPFWRPPFPRPPALCRPPGT